MSLIHKPLVQKHYSVFVADYPLMVYSLKSLINKKLNGVIVCGTANKLDEALHQISVMDASPDLLITEINFGSGCGLSQIDELRGVCPWLRILVFSSQSEKYFAARLIHRGCVGFVSKSSASEYVSEQIMRALSGDIVFGEQRNTTTQEVRYKSEEMFSLPVDRLTKRELEVFLKIGHGMSSRQIAGKLGLSVRTVELHRLNIKEKLGIEDSKALFSMAVAEIKYSSV